MLFNVIFFSNRGVMYPWKQVIYYDFNKNMNMKLLLELIEKCEDSNAEVKAMVCDMGNGTLLSTLEVYQNHKKIFSQPRRPLKKGEYGS